MPPITGLLERDQQYGSIGCVYQECGFVLVKRHGWSSGVKWADVGDGWMLGTLHFHGCVAPTWKRTSRSLGIDSLLGILSKVAIHVQLFPDLTHFFAGHRMSTPSRVDQYIHGPRNVFRVNFVLNFQRCVQVRFPAMVAYNDEGSGQRIEQE